MPDTIYSGSVTEFRASLVQGATHWHDHGAEAPRSAGLMASGFGYALAAVLGVAEREFGHITAARLAQVADDILMNGDSDDLNADVTPAEVPSA